MHRLLLLRILANSQLGVDAVVDHVEVNEAIDAATHVDNDAVVAATTDNVQNLIKRSSVFAA